MKQILMEEQMSKVSEKFEELMNKLEKVATGFEEPESTSVIVDSNLGITIPIKVLKMGQMGEQPIMPRQTYAVYKSSDCLYVTNLPDADIDFGQGVRKVKVIRYDQHKKYAPLYFSLKGIFDVKEGQQLVINPSMNILEIVKKG